MAWREFIQHNFWLKLAALVLATLTWLTIRFAIQHQIGFDAERLSNVTTREFKNQRVKVLSAGNDSQNVRILPAEVNVRVKGDPGLLRSLGEQDVHVFVNLVGLAESIQFLKPEALCPSGIQIDWIYPPLVRVERLDSP